tara:strand:+ start:180 stop:656 length:477 start_codon:yes stop_codon:yes gene_type:complete
MNKKFPFDVSDEKNKQSSHSPDIVDDSENLIRFWHSPEHIDEDDNLLPSAISTSDLKKHGFSVDREEFSSREYQDKQAKIREEKDPEKRKSRSLSTFKCKNVRKILSAEDDRAFVVVDDGIPENIAHTHIFSLKYGDGTIRKHRIDLIDLLEEGLEKI